jgi:hypothetical protein
MKLVYPNSLVLDKQYLERFLVSLHHYFVSTLILEEPLGAEILVTRANRPNNLKDTAKYIMNIRWIRATATRVPSDVFKPIQWLPCPRADCIARVGAAELVEMS